MLRPVGELYSYRYTISDIKVTVKGSNENPVILSQNVRSILISHQYKNNIIPTIQVTAAVEKNLYTLLSSSDKEISMLIIIHKYAKDSTSKAKELVLSKTFSVFNESDFQPDEMKTLYGDEEQSDGSIDGSTTQQLMSSSFYLVDTDVLTRYRVVRSLSAKSSTITDTIGALFASRGFKSLLMNKVPEDKQQPIFIPSYNLYGSLEYLNNMYGIFNTEYIFYMDMTENYLLDKTSLGKAVREGKPSTVNMYLEEFSSVESADSGSTIHNGAFVINLEQPPVINKIDTHSEYVEGTNIIGVNTEGDITRLEGQENGLDRMVMGYNKKIFRQLQYNTKEKLHIIAVNLNDIDITAIAPNLLYTITAHSKFQSANPISGKYRLNEATIIMNKETDSDFVLQCSAMFMKLQ